jgi:hypothetical protein
MNFSPLMVIDGSGEIEEARRLQQQPAINATAVRVGAVASAISSLVGWANDASVSYAIDSAVDEIRGKIDAGIRYYSDNNPEGRCYPLETCGCLVHIVLSEPKNWPPPRPRSFVTLFDADYGIDPPETLIRYLSAPSIFQGPPEGTDAIWRFVWATIN